MSEIHVNAIITPAKGKESRVRQLLINLGKSVQQHEPNAPRYQVFEQTNGEGVNVFVVQETYADQEAFDGHFKTKYFQELGAAIEGEGLVGGPLNIMTIKPIGGFASRL